MDDLISRQSVIERIDAVFPVDPMKSEYTKGIACGAALAKTYIKQLPSEQPEIIWCKDCKYWEGSELCRIWNEYISNEFFYCGCAERGDDNG